MSDEIEINNCFARIRARGRFAIICLCFIIVTLIILLYDKIYIKNLFDIINIFLKSSLDVDFFSIRSE